MNRRPTPPLWIDHLLAWFCDNQLWDGIRGDLQELFDENVEVKGPRIARILYVLHALGFLRLTFMTTNNKPTPMSYFWQNYFRTILRSLSRNKKLTAINMVGLTLAISCLLLATVYILDERAMDSYHDNGENIYRLYKRHINVAEQVDLLTYETSGLMGPTMYAEYAQVTAQTRVLPWFDDVHFTHEKQTVTTPHCYFADSSFLSFFQFSMMRGDATRALQRPGSVVLSAALAQAVFGDADPMGQQIVGINEVALTVTGVFHPLPRQASLLPEAVISWSTTVAEGPMPMSWMNNWLAQATYTFVRLEPGAEPKLLEQSLPEMMQRHFPERAENYFLRLMPLPRMFLYGEDIMGGRGMRVGSIRFLISFGLSALLILVIASVNYINISLSRATQTKTEVGIRKVLGSRRRQLVSRFVMETLLSLLVAALLGWLIIYLTLPYINTLTGKDLPLAVLWQPLPILLLLGFVVVLGFGMGLYPAFVLSHPAVSTLLKNASAGGRDTRRFTQVLLTLQYGASVFLIVCTLVIVRQTRFLENKPLGFDQNQVLVVEVGALGAEAEIFENMLRRHPNIQEISIGRSALGAGSYTTTVTPSGHEDEVSARIFGVDEAFFKTYGLKLVQGRAFREESPADSAYVIINEAFARSLNWQEIADKTLRFSADNSVPILGIVNDFHINSLATTTIEPMVLYLSTGEYRNASIKLGTGNMRETLDYIDDAWHQLEDRTPMTAQFVDAWFQSHYEKERQLLRVTMIYAIISLLLCGMGLYGITLLILQQRMKELSIRRVLGAQWRDLLALMNKPFFWIIVLGFVTGAPIAYVVIQQWLSQFAYQITPGITPWAIALVSTLVVSLLVVSGLSLRTATTNPATHLRSE
ncbi:MAG: FtsX-like permease family protein [Bacteroidota bacterium]